MNNMSYTSILTIVSFCVWLISVVRACVRPSKICVCTMEVYFFIWLNQLAQNLHFGSFVKTFDPIMLYRLVCMVAVSFFIWSEPNSQRTCINNYWSYFCFERPVPIRNGLYQSCIISLGKAKPGVFCLACRRKVSVSIWFELNLHLFCSFRI